jgi:predicted component of type VI protein secretion system
MMVYLKKPRTVILEKSTALRLAVVAAYRVVVAEYWRKVLQRE